MVTVPRVTNRSFAGAPSLPRADETVNTGGEAIGQATRRAGQALNELGQRMFQDAMAEQQAQLELEAQKRLERAQTEAIQSPDFRNAPETFKDRAKEEISDVVDQANPAIQGELRRNLAQQAASATADLRRRSVRMSQDAAVAAYNNKAETEIGNFAQADDPQERKAAMNRASDIAKRIVRSGAETPEEVKQRLDSTRQSAHVQRAEFLRRNDRLGEARDWVQGSDQLNEEQKRVLLDQIENEEEQVREELSARANQAAEFIRSTGRSPDQVDGVPYAQIKRQTAGTDVGEELREVERLGTEIRGHVAQPLRDQRAELREMGQPTSPSELRRKQAFQKATKTAQEALKDGRALEYMSNQGLLGTDLPPLFNENGEVSPSALRARQQAANRAENYFGTSSVMPLRKSERQALRNAVNQSESAVVQQTFRTMSQTLGKKRTRLVATNLASDNPTAGVALYAAPDAPKTSRTILDARGALDGVDNLEMPSSSVREAIEAEYGKAFAGSPRTRGAYVEAAKNVYAMKMNQAGELEWNDTKFRSALRLVANGKVTSTGAISGGPTRINERMTLPPSAGTDKETFRRAVSEGINQQNIVDFGNGTPAYMNAQGELVELSPRQLREAKLTFVGNGQYTFELNGGAVMAMRGGSNAGPFTMDLEEVTANMGATE